MTAWGASAVRDIAAGAGWKGPALVDATALAMAASMGADHYAHNPISAPGAERRGLWAVRIDEVPDELSTDLWDPKVCAEVAHALWELSGQTFGWHPTWNNGSAARIRPAIELHLARGGKPAGPVSTMSFQTQLAHTVGRANALQHALDMGRFPVE